MNEIIADKEAGIALITGQIVEAWLGRQPIAKGNVSPDDLVAVIMAIRWGLTAPLVADEAPAAEPKPNFSVVQ